MGGSAGRSGKTADAALAEILRDPAD